MVLIENMLLVNLEDKENHQILINTLNGKVNILSKEETECVKSWQKMKNIQYKEKERALFEELNFEGYLVKDRKEEEQKIHDIWEACRYTHKKVSKRNEGVVFVLTYMCNFACPYCYENALSYQEKKVMTKEMVDKIFEIHQERIKNISFFGGEPFLPETKEIIRYIISKSSDSLFSATTNGYYLSEFIEILTEIKVANITITLDGPKELHNKTRYLKNGEGSFDKIEEGIRRCLEKSIPVKIRMNISKANMEQCLLLRDTFIQQYPQQYDRQMLMFELQPIFQLSLEEKAVLNEKLCFEKSTPTGNPYKHNMIVTSISPVMRYFVNNAKGAFVPKYCNCDAEERRLFYDAEGDIYACILSLKNKVATVGSYYPEYHLKDESIMTRNIEAIEKCKSCKMKFLCGGGCANEIISSDGNVMKPNCTRIYHEIYKELPNLVRKHMKEQMI